MLTYQTMHGVDEYAAPGALSDFAMRINHKILYGLVKKHEAVLKKNFNNAYDKFIEAEKFKTAEARALSEQQKIYRQIFLDGSALRGFSESWLAGKSWVVLP
jgi:hypothetical protein